MCEAEHEAEERKAEHKASLAVENLEQKACRGVGAWPELKAELKAGCAFEGAAIQLNLEQELEPHLHFCGCCIGHSNLS